jgi:hypothetical protein
MFLRKAVICPRCGYSGGGGTVSKYLLLPTQAMFYWCNECSTVWMDLLALKQKEKPLYFDFDFFEKQNLNVLEFNTLTSRIDWGNELEIFETHELWEVEDLNDL